MGRAEKVSTKEPSERKRKSKKSRELDAGTAEETTREGQEPAAGSSRVLAEDNSAANEQPKAKKKKRKAKEESTVGQEDTPASNDVDEPKRKKKSKGKEREADTSTATTVVEDEVKTKKSKKRKDRKDEAVAETANEEDRPRKQKKRKRESKSSLPDPERDGELSDQAKKALSYAYSQAEEPSSWKFNKAKQNWLLRNIWSEESIPDTHVALTNKYLAGVQGGVRETLIKTCREIIAANTVEEPVA
ncbi:hypothetical protein PHLGIDRAFT_126477, partial [Phlebiopsis gigantea 11061_1 CR5-6]